MSNISDAIKKLQEERRKRLESSSLTGGYGSTNKESQPSWVPTDRELSMGDESGSSREIMKKVQPSMINASRDQIESSLGADDDDSADLEQRYREMYGSGLANTKISDRETEYQAKRHQRPMSPSRGESSSSEIPERSYRDIMIDHQLDVEEDAVRRQLAAKQLQDAMDAPTLGKRKRGRWDEDGFGMSGQSSSSSEALPSSFGASSSSSSSSSKWDETPITGTGISSNRSKWDETPVSSSINAMKSSWDETPVPSSSSSSLPTSLYPTAAAVRKKSRWDETPVMASMSSDGTAGGDGTMATPFATASHLTTPAPSSVANAIGTGVTYSGLMTPEVARRILLEREVDERNRPWLNGELNDLLPKTGYRIMEPPVGYSVLMSKLPQRKLAQTPLQTPGFSLSSSTPLVGRQVAPTPQDTNVPFTKPEDYQFFGRLLDGVDEDTLPPEEMKERKVMKLLLKIKNGTPPQRKTAFRVLNEKCHEFGAGLLFNHILPLLMSPTLEDQERHLLVKTIDRIMFKLGDLVRPFVHKILVVIEPMLIDEDFYARVEGREIISNLSKAAGLTTMIATMRPDLDHVDEYVRNTTARAFAVVGSALGVPTLAPFLKAVCQSRKSWQARHTGIRIVQQISILVGCAILPHLKMIIEIIEHGLVDEQAKVQTMTALAIAALAEACFPYGIEAFDSVLKPLWQGVNQHKGKSLTAFLKAIGFIIPLMSATHVNYFSKEIMTTVIREFSSPDDEMKKVVLKVVHQCVGTDGIDAAYVSTTILPDFFRCFWTRRMALDRRNYGGVVETTVEIANRVGAVGILDRVVFGLKDEAEPFRRMTMETVEKIIANLGVAGINSRLESQLMDGILYAFQEQATDETEAMLTGFGTIVNAFGERCKPYIPQIAGTIKWRLNNRSARIRMQAADLVRNVAQVMKLCEEEQVLGHLGLVLYENLGEEYPEVLGSILGGLKAVVNVIGMSNMNPPIKDLLPRLTPILKNRHEKVQENVIDLVGRIADRGAESVNPKEWIRICFELLEMLKAHKKSIRRASVNTFGYIAKAIGPHDVLHTLLSNLRVQERQMRVCTTIAIAIVAETCGPFTVLPALMNEYRVLDINVQNGVLKALSFLFEYIGEVGKDYVYAVAPLLQDALMDRDRTHRQTAATTVKHICLGVIGLGCEDVLHHLLNYVWPNVFETSQHMMFAAMEAIEGLSVALGPGIILVYLMQGLFHPARRVRDNFWKIYNSLYIYGADSLTPFYPRLENDAVRSYKRTQLELII